MLTNYQVNENTLVQVLYTGDVVQEIEMTEADFAMAESELSNV